VSQFLCVVGRGHLGHPLAQAERSLSEMAAPYDTQKLAPAGSQLPKSLRGLIIGGRGPLSKQTPAVQPWAAFCIFPLFPTVPEPEKSAPQFEPITILSRPQIEQLLKLR